MWTLLSAAIVASVPSNCAAVDRASSVSGSALAASYAAYDAFRKEHGRSSDLTDSVSYETRRQLFEKFRLEVEAHNARQPPPSWRAVVNRFADYTPEEHSALRGYRRVGGWEAAGDLDGGGSSFLQVRDHELAATADWRSLSSSKFLRDQGACGSCWAVAAAGALEMHAELKGSVPRKVSANQLVDCTPNPQNCGGTGGCKGATSELAFKYASENGLSDEEDYRYLDGDGVSRACQASSMQPAVSVGSYRRLPTNKLMPLMKAVSTQGPVVVSVDADKWAAYASGVFNSCKMNATVDHAVVLMGYGRDKGTKKNYWTIRNSWGPLWGENGHIRIERHSSDNGNAGYCGTDFDPKKGVGCDGGPQQIPVCGMCGILSDSSYPVDVKVKEKVGNQRKSTLNKAAEHTARFFRNVFRFS